MVPATASPRPNRHSSTSFASQQWTPAGAELSSSRAHTTWPPASSGRRSPTGWRPTTIDEPLSALLDQKGWAGVVEVVAEEGDVVLAHRLMFHSSNPNHGTRPRVMAQPAFSMTEPKRTEGDGFYPIEIALARARP